MDETKEPFVIRLPDWGAVLMLLSQAIDAPYEDGEFEAVESQFHRGELTSRPVYEWSLIGRSGCKLTIILEARNSLYYGGLIGEGDAMHDALECLKRAIISQQGDLQP